MSSPTVLFAQTRAGKGVRCFDSAFRYAFPLEPTDTAEVYHAPVMSSVLTSTFNHAWVKVLCPNEEGVTFTHWGILHDDIVPEMAFLSKMLRVAESHDADVLSAVSPIKDHRGLTSTALEHPGDPWRVRRLTMAEVFDREPTWTEPGLLVNSALMLIRLGPWANKLAFRTFNRIAVNEKTGEIVGQQISEDWDFTRQCHSLGLRVFATREIGLYHEEDRWANTVVWGSWKTDESYFESLTNGITYRPLTSPNLVYPVRDTESSLAPTHRPTPLDQAAQTPTFDLDHQRNGAGIYAVA